MSKEEFDYYHYCFRRCGDTDCEQKNHLEILNKSVDKMNDNEYEQFEDLVMDCYTGDPRKLRQFEKISRKNLELLSENEIDFVDSWNQEIESYTRKHCPDDEQKKQIRRHRFGLICLGIMSFGFGMASLMFRQ